MDDADNFEWNDDKAIRNYIKHNVSFEEATNVFRDPLAKDDLDDQRILWRRAIYILVW